MPEVLDFRRQCELIFRPEIGFYNLRQGFRKSRSVFYLRMREGRFCSFAVPEYQGQRIFRIFGNLF